MNPEDLLELKERLVGAYGSWGVSGATDGQAGFEPSESTTVISGGLYRTLSDTGVDYGRIDTPVDDGHMRASLNLQLNSLRPSKQFVSNVSRLIGEMTTTISTYLDSSASLVPYGSVASNLALNDSAVDLLVFIPPDLFAAEFPSSVKTGGGHHAEIPVGMIKEYEVRQSMRKALVKVSELFTVFCGLYLVKLTNVVPLSSITAGSKVPVLTMSDPVSGVTFEIVCNNVLPLFSTRLLKSYNSLVPSGELRDFVLLVKHWARHRGLVGSANGELSGFAWTTLCIFYCQSCLQVMPSLQALTGERQQWTDPFGSHRRCDVGFEDEKSLEPVMIPDSASLFMGFIDFYANYWNWKTGVVSIRLGRIVNMDNSEIFIKQTPIERTDSLIIEDPFDIKKDLCTSSLDRLRNELVESALLLNAGETIGSLMAPACRRRRQHRAESAF
jgi:DNA polymerase sigma